MGHRQAEGKADSKRANVQQLSNTGDFSRKPGRAIVTLLKIQRLSVPAAPPWGRAFSNPGKRREALRRATESPRYLSPRAWFSTASPPQTISWERRQKTMAAPPHEVSSSKVCPQMHPNPLDRTSVRVSPAARHAVAMKCVPEGWAADGGCAPSANRAAHGMASRAVPTRGGEDSSSADSAGAHGRPRT